MAVTGQLPFNAGTYITILKKKLTNEIAPPRQLVPTLSDRIDLGIRRSLRADPKQRFASCREFLQALTGTKLEEATASVLMSAPALVLPLLPESSPRSDRRAAPRYPSSVGSSCQPLGGEEIGWQAVVQDVSTTGLRLLVERRFEPGTVLIIKLLGSKAWVPAVVLGRVVRVEAHTSGKWILGCVFGGKLGEDEVGAMRSSSANAARPAAR